MKIHKISQTEDLSVFRDSRNLSPAGDAVRDELNIPQPEPVVRVKYQIITEDGTNMGTISFPANVEEGEGTGYWGQEFFKDENGIPKKEMVHNGMRAVLEENTIASSDSFIKIASKAKFDFFVKRQNGAKDIARKAKKKGGASMLTAWHFEAKEKPYDEVLTAIEDKKEKSFFEKKCRELMREINFNNMTQKQFQAKMGELEVWGEALYKVFGRK